jgi:signal peptidase
MRPVYARGDAVLFEKVNASDIAKDDILVFRREGIIVTHRVVSIESRNNTLFFITRGDNNEKPDDFETSADQVLGRVVMIGHYIGLPTLWINELFNQG